MEQLLLSNLAHNQAFDRALQAGKGVDRVTAEFTRSVLFEQDEGRRVKAINAMESRLVGEFQSYVLPAAVKVGLRNATTVLAGLPDEVKAGGIEDPALRRRVLAEGNIKPATRVAIVRKLVNDRANTLENRLNVLWLEPGQRAAEKLARLKMIHDTQQAAQVRYADELDRHLKGEGGRPRKPQLDFMAALTSGVKSDFRAQARRAGTDAETHEFVKQGFTQLAWVTVNASEACPDCKSRQGVQATAEEWERLGKPGGGATVCRENCFCMLVPAKTLRYQPGLAQKGLVIPPKPATPQPAAVTEAAPAKPKRQAKAKPADPFAGWTQREDKGPGSYTDGDALYTAGVEQHREWQQAVGSGQLLPADQSDIVNALSDVDARRFALFDESGKVRGAISLIAEKGQKTRAKIQYMAAVGGDEATRNQTRRELLAWASDVAKAKKQELTWHDLGRDKPESDRFLAGLAPDLFQKFGSSLWQADYRENIELAKRLGRPKTAKLPQYQSYREWFVQRLAEPWVEGDAKIAQLAAMKTTAAPAGSAGNYAAANITDAERRQVLKVLAVPEAERYQWRSNTSQMTAGGDVLANAVDVGEEFLRTITRRRASDPHGEMRVDYIDAPKGRAFQKSNYTAGERNRKNNIALDRHDPPAVVVHEWGHEYEAADPGMERAAAAFLKHRVKDEPIKQLNKIPGLENWGFEDHEQGREDDFRKLFAGAKSDRTALAYAHYVGKHYNQAATEVTSMGLQTLYEDPAGFAQRDPEYLKFILGQLDGRWVR